MRSGGTPGVTTNFTGQRRDDTGLLFYNARYYDPAIGRFLSADTVVPGAGALTLTPSDATAAGMWGAGGGGPANPQELNRYSYALNNPVGNADPTGHCVALLVLVCVAAAPAAAEFVGVVVTAVVGAAVVALAAEVGHQAGLAERAAGEGSEIPEIVMPHDQYPEAVEHVEDAQDAGYPDIITIDREGARSQRRASLSGTSPIPGKDRDEYPPAVAKEGGQGASVRPIDPSDNRGAGSYLGSKLKPFPNGTRVRIVSSRRVTSE